MVANELRAAFLLSAREESQCSGRKSHALFLCWSGTGWGYPQHVQHRAHARPCSGSRQGWGSAAGMGSPLLPPSLAMGMLPQKAATCTLPPPSNENCKGVFHHWRNAFVWLSIKCWRFCLLLFVCLFPQPSCPSLLGMAGSYFSSFSVQQWQQLSSMLAST